MSETCELKAVITTSKGEINLHLFAAQAPMTVANFVNLCQRNYYDGLTFHRVLANFMIQGGCPYGSGTGGPGYNFADEFSDDLHHDRPGILSMANAGPGTNGSQFFVTHVPTPWLDNHHTIFGSVIGDSDQEVVNSIAQGDTIETIAIEGDSSLLLEQHKDAIAQWNNDIDKAFPHLAA